MLGDPRHKNNGLKAHETHTQEQGRECEVTLPVTQQSGVFLSSLVFALIYMGGVVFLELSLAKLAMAVGVRGRCGVYGYLCGKVDSSFTVKERVLTTELAA